MIVQMDLFRSPLERVVPCEFKANPQIKWDALILGQWHRCVEGDESIGVYACRAFADRYLGKLQRIYRFPAGTSPEDVAQAIADGSASTEWPE